VRSLGVIVDSAIRAGFSLARKIPGLRGAMARYEAGYIQWGARRWLLSTYQDARFELDWSVTMEICRKHIHFCENNPLVGRIENLCLQFGVGMDGLKVVPNAGDPAMDKKQLEAWNIGRAERWEKFCESPDLSNALCMSELTKLWERGLFRVGNVIVLKCADENGQLKVQTIDRLRLETPPQFAGEEGKTVCQGIRLKKITVPVIEIYGGKRVKRMKEIVTGRPEVYYIRDEFETDKFAEIPAENVIHRFDCLMPGQMVGIPRGHRAINLIHDFEDLHILEMDAAKLAARIANVETNPSGELSTSDARRINMKVSTQSATGANVTKDIRPAYKVSVGAQEIALRSGDKLENFMVHRPTVAQQDYWDFLLSQICVGYNVPKLLVIPYSLQGTVTRADLDVCSVAFLADFEIVAGVLREIYEWWSERDIKFNRENLGQKIPARPHDCVIRPPRAPNVDVGYNANALALEMEMGKKSLQDVLATDNKDWRQHLREIAETEAFIDQLAKEFSITPERIAFKQFKSGANEPDGDESNSNEEGGGTGKKTKKKKEPASA
jgi:hypothetical protein